MSDHENITPNFGNIDPHFGNKLEKQLEYESLRQRRNEGDEDFEKFEAATRLKYTISVAGFVGLNAEGEKILEQARREYAPIRAAREAARIKSEKEKALSEIITRWVQEKTPVFLTVNNIECPEIASAQITKFSGFENPKPFVILRRQGSVRKIVLSEKWAASENGEKISGSSFEISATELDMDAVEKLFGLPVSDLRISE
jgi:hypothetical protein